MSQYNVDLMLAVREQIISHPETHNQHDWAQKDECGTTHCIAGWACVLGGMAVSWDRGTPYDEGIVSGLVTGGEHISDAARRLLGIDDAEADELFWTLCNDRALELLDELIEKGKNAP